ncbi:hypothetical protein SASPL_155286 [Salvia splendens]|uniref:Geranylgeranyl diphosphate synthase, type II n=1 Tax=Salvia splendens TaxID=180675 RepID=A0A8X8Z0H5_SALSN|nr:hypothetical protein SASPL_155286 [Salvia splendens]
MVFSSVIASTPHVCLPKIARPALRRTIRCSAASVSPGFDLKTYWTSLIREIDQKLDEAIPVKYPQQIYESMRYSVLAKGAKRAPPVMCVAACEIFGGNRLAAFPTACALEMKSMLLSDYWGLNHMLRLYYNAEYRLAINAVCLQCACLNFDSGRIGFGLSEGSIQIVVPLSLISGKLQSSCPKVHAASLIHDDLPCMDDDPSRRGKPSNHTVFGEDMAILAGDALFPLGFQHIVSHTPTDLVPQTCLLRVIAEIARAVGSTGMAAGQFLDLEGGPNAVDLVQEKKFGEMGQCSAVCGGLLAGASDDEIEHLRKYGRAVGILYEVVDDIREAKQQSGEEDGSKGKGKGKSYVSVYGVEKAMEVAENLRSQAKKELDRLEKYGDKVMPLYSFVDYAADRYFGFEELV